jgi:hypothetical protein
MQSNVNRLQVYMHGNHGHMFPMHGLMHDGHMTVLAMHMSLYAVREYTHGQQGILQVSHEPMHAPRGRLQVRPTAL